MPTKKLHLQNVGLEELHNPVGVRIGAQMPKLPLWRFEADFRRLSTGGGLTLQRLDVFPEHHERSDAGLRILSTPPGGITSSVLRAVPLATIRDELARFHFAGDWRSYVEWATGLSPSEFRRRPRPGRAGREDVAYAEIAQAYLARCSISASPVADLAAEMHFARQTVADKLAEARRRGLLESAGKGRRGGWLTPKALELLAKQGPGR